MSPGAAGTARAEAHGGDASVPGLVAPRRKVAILTNLLAPNRLPIFERLGERFAVTVLYSGEESNRDQWRGLERQVRGFAIQRLQGFSFTSTKRQGTTISDLRHLHVDPGLISALLRLRPDAIITAEMGFRSLVALAYGRCFGCPVWVWWGGTLHTERGISGGKRLFRRWFVRKAHRWFSYGRTSTEYLESLGIPKNRIVELQNCVPEAAYLEPQAPLISLDVRPVILCVGQFISRKGVDLLLSAAGRVQATGFTFSLLLVGSGPEKERLQRQVRELGLSNVHFCSPQPPERMPGVYRSADLLVFPTREDVWGLVANEALWSGLPSLVSIYAGCAAELVPPESTFDPLDLSDFTAKLTHAILGKLPPPDRGRLKGIAEVSGVIARELDLALDAV